MELHWSRKILPSSRVKASTWHIMLSDFTLDYRRKFCLSLCHGISFHLSPIVISCKPSYPYHLSIIQPPFARKSIQNARSLCCKQATVSHPLWHHPLPRMYRMCSHNSCFESGGGGGGEYRSQRKKRRYNSDIIMFDPDLRPQIPGGVGAPRANHRERKPEER